MKKIISVFVVCALLIGLVGCSEGSNNHEGEAKTPKSSSSLKGQDYKEAVKDFEENGFQNIQLVKIEDLITGWLTKDGEVESVSVDGKEDYSSGKWYPNTVEVVISYHTFAEKKESTETTAPKAAETTAASATSILASETTKEDVDLTALMEAFPLENAKRAAVVSITNYYAMDVYTEDGNDYDRSKFHSYADHSGAFTEYYMSVESWGTWTAKDTTTWHVESLLLQNTSGNVANASLDVRLDGANCVLSNIVGTYGNPDSTKENANNLHDIEEWSDTSLFLVIPPELIKDDREDSSVDKYEEWVGSQFSVWNGSHKELNELIENNLNDQKSFKHIETTYEKITLEGRRDELNQVLESFNVEGRVEIGDLWITVQFSAKNDQGDRVEQTAFGIASFSNDTITLVYIE